MKPDHRGDAVPDDGGYLHLGRAAEEPRLAPRSDDVDVLVDKARRQYTAVSVENLDLKPAVLLRQPVAYLQNFTEADKNILASKRLRRIYLRAANQIHCVALPL